ncbi:hypothetical protein AGIG_G1804 [Arapaima gigas]
MKTYQYSPCVGREAWDRTNGAGPRQTGRVPADQTRPYSRTTRRYTEGTMAGPSQVPRLEMERVRGRAAARAPPQRAGREPWRARGFPYNTAARLPASTEHFPTVPDGSVGNILRSVHMGVHVNREK